MDGNRLRLLREEKKLNQEDLAGILSVSTSAIGMYERDFREPDDDTKIKISKYFDCSVDYLLGITDSRKNTESLFNLTNLEKNDINDIHAYIEFLKFKKKKYTNAENS